MKKRFLSLFTLCLVYLLGVTTNAWGNTATCTSLSSKSTNEQTVEAGKPITYKCSGSNSYENPARIYKNYTFTVASTDNSTITKIEITTPSSYPATGFTADGGAYSANAELGTWTGSKTSVVFTANAQIRVSQIVVTYTPSSTAESPTLTAAGVFTTSTFDVTITNKESGATVYYTTDGNDPTTSTPTSFTGTSKTIQISETTTVKAMAAISGKDNSSITEATYTYEASIANTPETAYTTAQAKDLIDAGSSQLTTTKVYVKGTVSEVEKFNSNGSITYWLDSNSFEIYNGLNDNGEQFTSIDDVKVGAEVIVYGTIKKYSSIYEMGMDNWLVSYTEPESPKTTATISLSNYHSSLVTGGADNITITYNGDGTLSATSSDPTVASVSLVGTALTISALKAGSTTITVSAPATDLYTQATKYYTLTVSDPAPAASLPFEFDGGKDDIANTTGMSQSGIGTNYSASPKLKFDDQGDNVVINFNEAAKKVIYKLKGNSVSGTYAFDVMESTDGISYTTVYSHNSIESQATEYRHSLNANSRYVKFVYTTKASGNIALGKISIVKTEDPDLAFEESSYRFFTDSKDMAVKAISKNGSTGAITYSLTEGDETVFLIDENTGDIVCETAGTYKVTATIDAVEGYESDTATCTVKILEPIFANSIIVANTDGGAYAMKTTLNEAYFESTSALDTVNGKYVYTGDINDILFYTNTEGGKTTIQNPATIQYVQATAAKKVSYTDNPYEWTNDGEKLEAATSSHGTLQYNTGNPRFTTYGTKTGQYAQISTNYASGYVRTGLTAGNWGTICMPCGVSANDYSGVTFYSIVGKRVDGSDNPTSVVLSEETGDLVAGRPYFFLVNDEAEKLVAAYSGEEAAAGNYKGLVGTFTDGTSVNQGYYLLSGGKIHKVAVDGCYVNANRAYIIMANVPLYSEPSSVKGVVEFALNDETAIESLDANGNVARNGKYFEKGSVVIVKNNTKYNVSGQRIK